MNIAVIGEDEFTLGFRLAGVRAVQFKIESDIDTLLRDE